MNYKPLTAISVIGVSSGIALFLYEWTFSIWGCFCAASGSCICPVPLSYYIYVYILPFMIIGVSVVVLIFSLRHQRRLKENRVNRLWLAFGILLSGASLILYSGLTTNLCAAAGLASSSGTCVIFHSPWPLVLLPFGLSLLGFSFMPMFSDVKGPLLQPKESSV